VQLLVAAEPDFQHLSGLGWASLGVLELTALPTIGAERWVPWVRGADVLLVDGGDASYLCHWMRESGLADLLPSLPETVWVGVSAGSMVMTPRVGNDFVEWPSAPDDRTLGVVDGSLEVVSEGHWTKFAPVRRSDSAGGAPGRRSSPRCTARPEP
jgi:dipeptidase E